MFYLLFLLFFLSKSWDRIFEGAKLLYESARSINHSPSHLCNHPSILAYNYFPFSILITQQFSWKILWSHTICSSLVHLLTLQFYLESCRLILTNLCSVILPTFSLFFRLSICLSFFNIILNIKQKVGYYHPN